MQLRAVEKKIDRLRPTNCCCEPCSDSHDSARVTLCTAYRLVLQTLPIHALETRLQHAVPRGRHYLQHRARQRPARRLRKWLARLSRSLPSLPLPAPRRRRTTWTRASEPAASDSALAKRTRARRCPLAACVWAPTRATDLVRGIARGCGVGVGVYVRVGCSLRPCCRCRSLSRGFDPM